MRLPLFIHISGLAIVSVFLVGCTHAPEVVPVESNAVEEAVLEGAGFGHVQAAVDAFLSVDEVVADVEKVEAELGAELQVIDDQGKEEAEGVVKPVSDTVIEPDAEEVEPNPEEVEPVLFHALPIEEGPPTVFDNDPVVEPEVEEESADEEEVIDLDDAKNVKKESSNQNGVVTETTSDVVVEQMSVELSSSGPGVSGSYTVIVDEGATVLEVMEQARMQGFIFVTTGFGGLGVYVDSVGGLQEDTRGSMYWVYSVNGAKATLGVSQMTLTDGDAISWVYEAGF